MTSTGLDELEQAIRAAPTKLALWYADDATAAYVQKMLTAAPSLLSDSRALLEARKLLEWIAQPKPCVDMADPVEDQLRDALHEIGLIRTQARAFLGEQK